MKTLRVFVFLVLVGSVSAIAASGGARVEERPAVPSVPGAPGFGGPGNYCEVAPGGMENPSCLSDRDLLQPARPFPMMNGASSSYAQQSLIRVNNCPALTLTKRHAVTVAHCMESIVSNAGESWTSNRASLENQPVRFMNQSTGSITTMYRDLDIKRYAAYGTDGDFCDDTHEDIVIIEFDSDLSAYTRARVYQSGFEGTPVGFVYHWDAITWWSNQSHKQKGMGYGHADKSLIDDGICDGWAGDEYIADFHNEDSDDCVVVGDSGGVLSVSDTLRLSHSLLSAGSYPSSCTFDGYGPMLKRHHAWILATANALGVPVTSSTYSFTCSATGCGGETYTYRLYDLQ